jgi:hypothetical protein
LETDSDAVEEEGLNVGGLDLNDNRFLLIFFVLTIFFKISFQLADAMEEGRTWMDLLDKRIFHPRFYVIFFFM